MGDLKKPLPVMIVEAIAWIYVALSLLGTLGALVAAYCDNAPSLLSILLGGRFPLAFPLAALAMSFGMVLSLRRGRRAWFLMPNTIALSICLIVSVGVLCYSASAGAVSLGLVALLLFAGPIVLLNLPVSTSWFKAKAKGGRPDSLGYMGVFLLFVMFILAVLVLPEIVVGSRLSMLAARSNAMAVRGRKLYVSMMQEKAEREAGRDWIDPSSFANSTQFVNALWAKFSGDKDPCPYADCWCVAVNPPDDDNFPVLVSANIDPRELLCPNDENQPLKLACPKEWGGTCFKFCEKAGVIVYEGGKTRVVKSKYARPKLIFRGGIPKPNSDTYFLTPTGLVNLVEGQVPPGPAPTEPL